MAASIRLYNTLTQSMEPLEPAEAGHVRLYLCGLTTYDHAHAGHARTNTTFDVLVRFLRARGLKVTFVRNITDVDDKIVKRAAELGEAPLSLSARMSQLNADELRAVGCLTPDHEPRVSDNIPEIIALVERLIERGHAYAVSTPKGRDVYFSVQSFEGYGKLSHRNLDDLVAGARVEVGDVKRDPADFALWKGAEGEGFGWDSPWGKGRPGWHIECSAMAVKYLGDRLDLHGGGMDLIFPHHENEIAQSEAAYGGPFSRVWMHGGFLNVDSEKMSKSLGNFVTIKDVLARYDAEALRYFFLGAHYRGPINFDVEKKDDGRVTFPGLEDAERRVEYLYTTRESLVAASAGAPPREGNAVVDGAREKVLSALDKDLNTPVALSVLAELAKLGNDLVTQIGRLKKDKAKQDEVRGTAAAAAAALVAACEPIGLMQASTEEFAARTRERRLRVRDLSAGAIDAKVKEREAARAAKDFARGDAIRAELTAMGVELLDVPGGGTTWRVML